VEQDKSVQGWVDDFTKSPTAMFLKMSHDYREKMYSDWRYEVKKIAKEATVSMKDMAMYLYIEKYHGAIAKELFKSEQSGEYIRRFLNEQGVNV
jgi:hypothetical protein